MATIFKCKVCGADLDFTEGQKVTECVYCGSKQTIPTTNNEKIIKLHQRGNVLRMKYEFDRAYNLYEQIISEADNDFEAYWNLVLCKYGVTYIEDYNGTMVPTINRISTTSILEDNDYLKALNCADVVARDVLINNAKEIAVIQNKVTSLLKDMPKYDIFISYKETDQFGDRTKDSVLAHDIYNELTKEGYKVFLGRVSLSGIMGQEYEPYIYAALTSAKIMLLVTTSSEYANAPWVRNEWSRFLALIKEDSSKKLIPCYKEMTATELPKEMSAIQAVNMDRLGFMQDLILGISKILPLKKEEQIVFGSKATSSIIRRCELLIENKDFEKAALLADTVLNEEPENARAYEILFLCDLQKTEEELRNKPFDFSKNQNYKMILKFGDRELKNKYNNILKSIQGKEYSKFSEIYNNYKERSASDLEIAINVGSQCTFYEDIPEKIKELKTQFDILNSIKSANKITAHTLNSAISLKDSEITFNNKKFLLVQIESINVTQRGKRVYFELIGKNKFETNISVIYVKQLLDFFKYVAKLTQKANPSAKISINLDNSFENNIEAICEAYKNSSYAKAVETLDSNELSLDELNQIKVTISLNPFDDDKAQNYIKKCNDKIRGIKRDEENYFSSSWYDLKEIYSFEIDRNSNEVNDTYNIRFAKNFDEDIEFNFKNQSILIKNIVSISVKPSEKFGNYKFLILYSGGSLDFDISGRLINKIDKLIEYFKNCLEKTNNYFCNFNLEYSSGDVVSKEFNPLSYFETKYILKKDKGKTEEVYKITFYDNFLEIENGIICDAILYKDIRSTDYSVIKVINPLDKKDRSQDYESFVIVKNNSKLITFLSTLDFLGKPRSLLDKVIYMFKKHLPENQYNVLENLVDVKKHGKSTIYRNYETANILKKEQAKKEKIRSPKVRHYFSLSMNKIIVGFNFVSFFVGAIGGVLGFLSFIFLYEQETICKYTGLASFLLAAANVLMGFIALGNYNKKTSSSVKAAKTSIAFIVISFVAALLFVIPFAIFAANTDFAELFK